MKMKTINRLVIAILLILSGACTSYLDLKPHGKTIPKTPEEYSALLHQMIYDIEEEADNQIMPNTNDVINAEAVSDNLDANIYLGQEIIPFYIGQLLDKNVYAKLYQYIRNCNIILDGLKEDGSDLSLKVKSVAHAMRGVCYFELARHYCEAPVNGVYPQLGMPLVDRFDMEARPVRSTYQQTIDFIENDFEQSLRIFDMQDQVFMFTEDVVKAYMARLFFWTAQWDKALSNAQELLDKYPVADRETFAQMVLGNKETNNMILRYKNTMSQSQYVSDRIYTTLKNRPVSIDFINVFDNRSKDVRFTESLNSRRNPIKLFIGSIRSEEMLLIAAESSYYLTDNEQALSYINTLRNNRIENHEPLTLTTIPNIEDASVVVKDAMGNNLTPLSRLIINERRKEMFMEGDRIMQLKRLGSPQFWVSRNGLAYTTYSFMYTYPIPADDIELNKGIIQNEGYTEFVYN